eukprot:6298694-Prymnesium_polylepis.1
MATFPSPEPSPSRPRLPSTVLLPCHARSGAGWPRRLLTGAGPVVRRVVSARASGGGGLCPGEYLAKGSAKFREHEDRGEPCDTPS